MTTKSLAPQNTSFLQTTKYTFLIPELPFARYFGQTVNLPGVATNYVEVSNPFASTYRHGDKLVYDPFTISAIIDEDLRVWQETYNWIRFLTKPTNFEEYQKREGSIFKDKYYDGILTINTNANNPNIRVKFRNVHPTSLGSLQFSSTDNAQTILSADVEFRYDYFEIERI